MATAKTKGTIGIVAAIIATVGIYAGTTLNKLTSSGVIDKTKTIYTNADFLTPCTNTGGKANYSACYFQNPFTGSGIIKSVYLMTEANPSGTQFDCGVVASLSNSGTQLRNNGNTASGSALVMATGSVILPPNWYLKCAAGKTPGNAFEAVILTELVEYHKL